MIRHCNRHVNGTKYSPLPIQKGQYHSCTFVYCVDIADCSSQVYSYLVSCKWPKLAVPLLHALFLFIVTY